MVGRLVTLLWGDGLVPVRVINPSHQPVTLKHNCKIAACLPVWHLRTLADDSSLTVDSDVSMPRSTQLAFYDLVLQDIDINSACLSPPWKVKLMD